ncbi:hypothetical protein COLO4_37603 [Corchorus olitorius]|uniref:Uncharacterized protein n=1 Tax=Corchorus olitorius TaxID=93759 RepID=A0A1R3G0K5_9ROSI|nr:hypothetical protein COLO4_37603 [Corchorus olitorius]
MRPKSQTSPRQLTLKQRAQQGQGLKLNSLIQRIGSGENWCPLVGGIMSSPSGLIRYFSFPNWIRIALLV